ncbi:MAG TPA: hypothetical protein VHU19_14025 [Pyrinomonadaceae bacterium]|nr:hypothetical protein [Pyrinomonadaceae bacterium]
MSDDDGSLDQRATRGATFIPNSYSTPNDYADQLMHLLSGEEWKVLSYTVRRIFGFQKRRDHVSLTQYQEGTRAAGRHLDYGTGLSRPTIIKALATLCKYGLMTLVALNDLQHNEGDCYALQLDASKVDMEGLLKRNAERRQTNSLRMAKARKLSPKNKKKTPAPASPDLSDLVSETYQQNALSPGKSDLPPVVSGTDRPRYVGLTHNNQIENQKKTRDTHTQVEPQPTRAREEHDNVCVSGEEEVTEEDYYAFARSKKSFHTPDAWAMTHWKQRDADKLVREWKEGRKDEAVKARRSEPPDNNMKLDEARMHVRSVLKVGASTNVSELLAFLKVSDADRERLRAEFVEPAASRAQSAV